MPNQEIARVGLAAIPGSYSEAGGSKVQGQTGHISNTLSQNRRAGNGADESWVQSRSGEEGNKRCAVTFWVIKKPSPQWTQPTEWDQQISENSVSDKG